MTDRHRHDLNYASPGDRVEESRRRIRFRWTLAIRLLVGMIVTGVLYLLLLAAVIWLTRLA